MSKPLWIALEQDRLLAVTGPDREKFLQGQTTTDFREVTPDVSRLGCVCNLKGRAIFSYRAINWRDTLWLLMDATLHERARLHLQKYIIFSKATLETPAVRAWGLIGPGSAALVREITGLDTQGVDTVAANDRITAVSLGNDRYLLLLEDDEHGNAVAARFARAAAAGAVNDWRLAQIRAGEAQIVADSAEIFQPQEINYPALNGVSYNKGCYTGQEIVARLYFRGKLKQWTHRFSAPLTECPAPNATLQHADGSSAGHVVMAARSEEGIEMLAVVKHDALEGLNLNGVPVTAQSLPYTVLPRD